MRASLPTCDAVEPVTEALKKFQGKKPARKKIGKLSMAGSRIGKATVKTNVKTSIIRMGLSNDQKKPKTEFLYLTLSSFLAKLKSSSLYLNRFRRFSIMHHAPGSPRARLPPLFGDSPLRLQPDVARV